MLTSLPQGFESAVKQIAVLGFTHVDVVGLVERPTTHLEALADSGLLVSCAAIGRGLASAYTLDAPSATDRRAAVEEMKRQVADAAHLGATHGYVVSGADGSKEGLARFAEACVLLADFAAGRMVCLCVEHCPGKALPSAAVALDWVEQIPDANLRLLLDVGHCLISREDPVRVIERAGASLGYVHLDDNDGMEDLHWPLLSGRLSEEMLKATLAALRKVSYDGALALELSAGNAEPVEGLRQGKLLIERLLLGSSEQR